MEEDEEDNINDNDDHEDECDSLFSGNSPNVPNNSIVSSSPKKQLRLFGPVFVPSSKTMISCNDRVLLDALEQWQRQNFRYGNSKKKLKMIVASGN